ncbi:MAG: YceH family protein [Acidobacteria bacterium]|nr:YceH family protein [Acidobacteriota bacterium]
MFIELNEIEARIIGCLIEKENATPDYYPLTLNALTNACNQKSNRFPVVDYDEDSVEQALESLQKRDIVYLFFGSGSRTKKYKHLLPKLLELDQAETAVICVLLLRGAQTLGELNQRTSRIYHFSGLDEVHQTVDALIKREEPLIIELPKQPGQKEARVMHLLSGEIDVENFVVDLPVSRSSNSQTESLKQELSELRAEFDTFKEEFAEFKKQFE